MNILKYGSISLFFLMIAVPGFAQSTPPAAKKKAPSGVSSVVYADRRRHGPPCWKQAGITPDMVNQRWKIEDDAKVEIAAVCRETTTGPQQKHNKIDQINAKTKQEVADLIPADKLAKFNQCEADLEKTHPASASEKKLGPCGGTIPTNVNPQGSEGMEHQHGGAPMNQ